MRLPRKRRIVPSSSNIKPLAIGPLGVSPATQIHRIIWQGLPGKYIAAAEGGLYTTLDYGENWGILRPNIDFNNTWPSGAVGRDLGFVIGPRDGGDCDPIVSITHLLVPGLEGGVGERYTIANDAWAVHTGESDLADDKEIRSYQTRAIYGLLQINSVEDPKLGFTNDGGVTWSVIDNTNVPGNYFEYGYDIGPSNTGEARIWIFTFDNIDNKWEISTSDDDGASWTKRFTNDDENDTHKRIIVHPTNPNKAVALFHDNSTDNPAVRYTTDAGVTWSSPVSVRNTGIVGESFGSSPGTVHGAWMESGRLVIVWQEGTGDDGHIAYSDDDGASWTVATSYTSLGPMAIAVGDGAAFFIDGNTFQAGNTVFRSTDGITWTEVQNWPGTHLPLGMAFGADSLWVLLDNDGTFYEIPNPGSTFVPVARATGPIFDILGANHGNLLAAVFT